MELADEHAFEVVCVESLVCASTFVRYDYGRGIGRRLKIEHAHICHM